MHVTDAFFWKEMPFKLVAENSHFNEHDCGKFVLEKKIQKGKIILNPFTKHK